MDFRYVLRLIGIALGASVLGSIIAVAIARFALGQTTFEEWSTAVFWAAVVLGALVYIITPKHSFVHSVSDARQRLLKSRFEFIILNVLVIAITAGISYLLLFLSRSA